MVHQTTKVILIFFVFCLNSFSAFAQDDLIDMLNNEASEVARSTYTKATFKSSRLINGHSIENIGPGVLDFRIAHRFGLLNEGNNFFGLDQAKMRLGLEYGVNHRLMVGIGRSTQEKAIDGFLKYRFMKQTNNEGTKKIPLSITFLAAVDMNTTTWTDNTYPYYLSHRLAYNFQILMARKFNNSLSLQLMPTLTHKNLVESTKDKNDILSIGLGGRLKLTNRFALTTEYYYVLPNQIFSYERRNSLGIGVDIETGGHVFQLMFTNGNGMIERQFITQTQDKIQDWSIRFGFNISRVFTISEKATRRFKEKSTYAQ